MSNILVLTAKEVEVLNMLSEGMSNKEISSYMNIRTSTVKWHIGNIFCKLNAKNRTHASNLAREHGLLSV